ncbi:hypothetical protein N7532_004359 [Penicillium argentinense]|uniref:Uncharacterized protein n=1 Tax=Penicillium argentinense TaxID=1131581 RepID=A0A9W9KER9_9EURO|nr:uncharacterized protein N7532_004359 [Penicillium argentinense]KAJ5103830.1 hypothetical protein N7532_004359 [Penicillium argentinense]
MGCYDLRRRPPRGPTPHALSVVKPVSKRGGPKHRKTIESGVSFHDDENQNADAKANNVGPTATVDAGTYLLKPIAHCALRLRPRRRTSPSNVKLSCRWQGTNFSPIAIGRSCQLPGMLRHEANPAERSDGIVVLVLRHVFVHLDFLTGSGAPFQ